MKELHTYRSTDKMSDLISNNYTLLMVMSRFGLSLGFGEKSVEEVCNEQGVDCNTFLTVANFIGHQHRPSLREEEAFSLAALVEYLQRAHTYFLEFNLPTIRRKLIEAINCSASNDVAFLILKFFDEYAREVRRHMEYENKSVFTYVNELLRGNLSNQYAISTFASHHQQVDNKLSELKNIIIKYYPGKDNNNLLNAVLYDIFNCEQDLATHCQVENEILIPAVTRLEEQLKKNGAKHLTTSEIKGTNEQEALSQREKEIIICVVKGMSNKAIAETLFLSIHTVITHRRNIARKLQIHSPAGLTIYAIANKLISLEEVKIS